MEYILSSFPITEDEYSKVDALFGDLAHYAAWQLVKKNVKNNHTDDPEDIVQEIRLASIHAVSYFKRQVFIESCLSALRDHIADSHADRTVWEELQQKWRDRTKHGANKQKFGEPEEKLLAQLVSVHVPLSLQPQRSEPLSINNKFITYCKAIIWNKQRSLGKKITREKSIRSGTVSLSEFDYLVASDGKISGVKVSS